MYGVLAMAHIWGLFAPTGQTWIYSFWKRLMMSIWWGKELAGFMMFNGDDCTPPWKSRLVSSIRRPEKLPWGNLTWLENPPLMPAMKLGNPELPQNPGVGSTPWVIWVGPWRFLDFTLPQQLETLNFGDCYDQNLSRLIMPNGVKSLTLPFTRFFHMQLEELDLPGGGNGRVTPRLSCSSCCVRGVLWIALCCVARRRRSCFYGSRDFTKKHGGSAPKMEI